MQAATCQEGSYVDLSGRRFSRSTAARPPDAYATPPPKPPPTLYIYIKKTAVSMGNSHHSAVSSNKLVVAKAVKASLVSRVNLVLHLVKARDKVNKDSLKVKVLVELVKSKASLVSRGNKANKADSSKAKADSKTKVTAKADSSKAKADSKTKVSGTVKATSNNKLVANRTKVMAKVKTNSSKVTELATSHVLTVGARDTLTLTVKRHHTRLGTRLLKTLPKKLVVKWLQLMQLNKLSQMQFRTPLRCLASLSRASSHEA